MKQKFHETRAEERCVVYLAAKIICIPKQTTYT